MFEPWVYKVLACLGTLALAYACLQTGWSWVRRLGLWLVFGTVALAVWFTTESWVLTLVGLLGWFALPLAQAIYLSRRLRFSLSRRLVKERLELEEFEDWGELTQELREADFTMEGEYGLKPSPIEYGFRLFEHREKNWVAGLALVRQGGVAISYVLVMTRAQDGQLWMTWDYPLSYGLKLPPHVQLYRCLEAYSMRELLEQHKAFLNLNEVVEASERVTAQEALDAMFGDTMKYNLNIGLLRSSKESGEEIHYSWRGTWFIACQVLRDMVRG
ncbi:MAG: hypothetical protein HC904_07160 [Blastochloris sp.]|nr:hypothetical protein [Blastochloris sp.]